jgi:hypothetical protein
MKNNFTVADAVSAAEGSMKTYAEVATGQLEKLSSTSWPLFFLENVLIVAFAVGLLMLYNDQDKWRTIVACFADNEEKKSTSTSTPAAEPTTADQPAAADIALCGPYTGDMNALVTALRVRGFIVLSLAVVKDARTHHDQYKIFIALSSALLSKLAVQHGLTVKTRAAYGVKEKSRLCVRAMDILKRSGIVFDTVTLLHDRGVLSETYGLPSSPSLSPLNPWSSFRVEEYFGAKVAVYFAWMHAVYLYFLLPCGTLAVLSLCFNRTALGLGVVACAYPVAGQLFVEWWKERLSFMRFSFDKTGSAEQEEEQEDNLRVSVQQQHNVAPETLAVAERAVWVGSLTSHLLTGALVCAIVVAWGCALYLQDLVYRPFTPLPFTVTRALSWAVLALLNSASHLPTVVFAVVAGLAADPLDDIVKSLLAVEHSSALTPHYLATSLAYKRCAVHFALKLALPLLLLWREAAGQGAGAQALAAGGWWAGVCV